MRRGMLIGLSVTGVLCLVLIIAIAKIGTQLDQARIERDDLQFEVEDLRNESQSLKADRDTLKQQVDEKLHAIEQMKAEAEKLRQPPSPRRAMSPNRTFRISLSPARRLQQAPHNKGSGRLTQ